MQVKEEDAEGLGNPHGSLGPATCPWPFRKRGTWIGQRDHIWSWTIVKTCV